MGKQVMHSFVGENGTWFNYNSDLSGEVLIHAEKLGQVSINGDDLMEFAAEMVRRRRLSQLEDMPWQDLLT